MARKDISVGSLPEKEMALLSVAEEKFMIYSKPLKIYDILQTRSQDNPFFLPRCLSYRIQAKKKRKSNSGGEIIFNYMDCNNKIVKAEAVKDYSCPFCSMKCGGPEGVKLHLRSSHDIFEYNFWLSEKDHPAIDVSLKPDAFIFGELSDGLEKHSRISFTYCRKHRKRSQRDGSNKLKRKIHFLELDSGDLPRETENELSHVNDDNVSFPATVHSLEKSSDVLTITQPEKAESSEPKVPLVSKRKMLSAARSEARSIERLKNRQFYHSKTYQPLSFEQVMSDTDIETEGDDEVADMEEHRRLDQLVDGSDEDKRFLFLWNSFVRKHMVVAFRDFPWACEKFIKLHEKELISPQAFGRWRQFMIKLWNLGLICAKTMDKCNTFLINSQAAAAAAAASAASSSTSQATANGNEQQPMEVGEE